MDFYRVTEGNQGLVARRMQPRKGKIVFFDGNTRIVINVTNGEYVLNFAKSKLGIGVEIRFAPILGSIRWDSRRGVFIAKKHGQWLKLGRGHVITYSREGRVTVLVLEENKGLAVRVAREVFRSLSVRS